MNRDDPDYRGQRGYTPRVLRMYDPFVHRQHIRDQHLDVGPGTGYCLDRSVTNPRPGR
jgi:hypothetical protein